jgi:hypothetical protein
MSRIIVTAVDTTPRYVEGVKVWLRSLTENAPDERIFVYAQNWDNVDSISSINPRAKIIPITNESPDPMVRNYIRYKLFLDLLPQYDMIAWIDNDAIIRKSLEYLWFGVTVNSVKYWRRPKREHLCFQGGVFVLGAGEKTKQYCRDILRGLETIPVSDVDRWYAPQLLAYTCIGGSGIDTIPLSKKYNDCTFDDESIIWHCKSGHFNEAKYQKEYQYYLGMVNHV